MKKDSIIDFLGFLIVKALSAFFSLIPLSIALGIGRCGGRLVYLVNVKRRAIAYSNIKAAFPEKNGCQIKRIVTSHFENLGMSLVELLKFPSMGTKYFDQHVTINNVERVTAAMKNKGGVIPLTAHFGNWEIASLAVSSKGYKVSVFAREQKYKRLNSLLNKYRGMTGSKVITKGFSVRDIIKTLKNNGIVAMLADQDAGASGVFIDFFGRPASVAPGPVVFGLKTKAVILPSYVRRASVDKHVVEIEESFHLVNTNDKEKDVRVNLEQITAMVESYIRKYPDQWLWSHKRWKTTPHRSVLVLSDGKPGHRNQAAAVAEMIKESLVTRLKARGIDEKAVVKIDIVEVKFKNKLSRLLLDIASLFAGARWQGCLDVLRFCLEKESFDKLKNKYADIVISCGASTVASNIFLKYENNAKNIMIMKPGLGRSRKFGLIILPRHDMLSGSRPNILVTEAAPNRITQDMIYEAASAIKDTSPLEANSGIGLLLGGDAKNFRLKKDSVEHVVDGLLKIAREQDLPLFISTSRRTSREIEAFLKSKLEKEPRCKLLVIASEKNREGIVPAILGLSKIAVISPDSISMISEGVSSGKAIVVFSEAKERTGSPKTTKYERTMSFLKEKKYIEISKPDNIYNMIKKILKDKPKGKHLDDRKNIIKRLEGIL